MEKLALLGLSVFQTLTTLTAIFGAFGSEKEMAKNRLMVILSKIFIYASPIAVPFLSHPLEKWYLHTIFWVAILFEWWLNLVKVKRRMTVLNIIAALAVFAYPIVCYFFG